MTALSWGYYLMLRLLAGGNYGISKISFWERDSDAEVLAETKRKDDATN